MAPKWWSASIGMEAASRIAERNVTAGVASVAADVRAPSGHGACNEAAAPIRDDQSAMPMESVPIQMTVRWHVPPREAQSITAVLQSLMVQTRDAPGCEGCSFSTEMGPLVVIRYVEIWRREADLQRQICSERFATLAELMERATEHPVTEFAVAGHVHGLEYAEAVRRACLG